MTAGKKVDMIRKDPELQPSEQDSGVMGDPEPDEPGTDVMGGPGPGHADVMRPGGEA